MDKGTIQGTVVDASGARLLNVSITSNPASLTAITDADGNFSMTDVPIGVYSLTADLPGYQNLTIASVGVAAGSATKVSMVLQIAENLPGTISGIVTDSKKTPTPLAGVTVTVEGSDLTAVTGADGSFSFPEVPSGPVFLSATAPSASYLDTETQNALLVPSNGDLTDVELVLSARPSDSAHEIGLGSSTVMGCATCHTAETASHQSSAHDRSLIRVQRDANGKAVANAFDRMLNGTLTTPRTVMVPLAGTISASNTSKVLTGTGTLFSSGGSANALQVGDTLGYTPTGLSWTRIGVIASIDSDSQLTLTANATFAPAVTSLSNAKYSVTRLSRTYTHMLPEDSNDIVAPAWPGVKATNPNYDPNDPCIYGAPTSGSCAAGGTSKYADGQVNVYLCNLKDGVNYLNDEIVQKFGGNPYSCADASFYDGKTTPAVPMVHTAVIYGGQGDIDNSGKSHPNMGVFKQRFQGPLSDIKAAAAWNYTKGKELDSLTLPIQFLESGDKVNGAYKMNGYHPTEQKAPGESWTQQTRTFSHACAGCHNTGMKIDWDMTTVTIPFGRDGAPNNSPFTFAAIKSYSFVDENLTCEHCHGPGSEHASTGGGKGNAIINPKYMTAYAQRQACGQCHAWDEGTNAAPAQDYGFEFPWNSDHADKIGGGRFVPGVYELADFFDNWDERLETDEAMWDPVANEGMVYGQAHRQQYTMLDQSVHTNNPYSKLTCTSCHDQHSQYLGSTNVQSSAKDSYAFTNTDFRNNVQCLSCHAGGGPLAIMPETGSFAALSKDDIANLQVSYGGTVTKNGVEVNPSGDEVYESQLAVSQVVSEHMYNETGMFATYDPTNESMPVGRCTSCHMPKVAKSGGYVTGSDVYGNKALVEGDQASHVFNVIWPWQSNALSRGGPTFQSGSYGTLVSPTNVKYQMFGFMPNSCTKCHTNARRASIACADSTELWPSFWPYSEHRTDPYWAACYVSSTAP